MRQPAQMPTRVRKSNSHIFQSPVAGWISNRAMSNPAASGGAQGAAVLDNFFPNAKSATLRRGSQLYATLGEGDKPVRSLFTFKDGNIERMFGANDDAIYDLTNIDSDNNYELATENDDLLVTAAGDNIGWTSTLQHVAMSGLTGGDWITTQFVNPDGDVFLRGVNGADPSFIYDGNTFDTSPAITFPSGETLTSADLSYIWSYKLRLFFIQKDSLDAWYLPVDQIAGELKKFPLGGIFDLGGSLLFGASWSLDSGNSGGLSDQCIFVSTQGEVAVYQGLSPDDQSWQLVGKYRIGEPLGKRAWIRAGGDIIVATSIGFIPLSKAIQMEYAALHMGAVSAPIEPSWNEAYLNRGKGWTCELWPEGQMISISLPKDESDDDVFFVVNSSTGAWARFTNWYGTCQAVFRGNLYFGSINGRVVQAMASGLDLGAPYTGAYIPLFEDYGDPMSYKTGMNASAAIRSMTGVSEKVTSMWDFDETLPDAPSSDYVPRGSLWDVGVWGEAVWSGRMDSIYQNKRKSISGYGRYGSVCLQITSGSVVPTDAEVISLTVTFDIGETFR